MSPLPGALGGCFFTWRNDIRGFHPTPSLQVKRTEWQVCAADPDSGKEHPVIVGDGSIADGTLKSVEVQLEDDVGNDVFERGWT